MIRSSSQKFDNRTIVDLALRYRRTNFTVDLIINSRKRPLYLSNVLIFNRTINRYSKPDINMKSGLHRHYVVKFNYLRTRKSNGV